jgi:hypothetical protein
MQVVFDDHDVADYTEDETLVAIKRAQSGASEDRCGQALHYFSQETFFVQVRSGYCVPGPHGYEITLLS